MDVTFHDMLRHPWDTLNVRILQRLASRMQWISVTARHGGIPGLANKGLPPVDWMAAATRSGRWPPGFYMFLLSYVSMLNMCQYVACYDFIWFHVAVQCFLVSMFFVWRAFWAVHHGSQGMFPIWCWCCFLVSLSSSSNGFTSPTRCWSLPLGLHNRQRAAT